MEGNVPFLGVIGLASYAWVAWFLFTGGSYLQEIVAALAFLNGTVAIGFALALETLRGEYKPKRAKGSEPEGPAVSAP
jgi:ammonia channel protein AmtB